MEALESSKGNVDQRYAEIVAARDQLKTELEAVSKERETLAKNVELSSAENKTITEEREVLRKVRIFVSSLQLCSQFCVSILFKQVLHVKFIHLRFEHMLINCRAQKAKTRSSAILKLRKNESKNKMLLWRKKKTI